MGQLIRFLLLLTAVWLAIRIVRNFLHRAQATQKPKPSGEMIACTKCGTFVLRGEAIERHGSLFCTPGHADENNL